MTAPRAHGPVVLALLVGLGAGGCGAPEAGGADAARIGPDIGDDSGLDVGPDSGRRDGGVQPDAAVTPDAGPDGGVDPDGGAPSDAGDGGPLEPLEIRLSSPVEGAVLRGPTVVRAELAGAAEAEVRLFVGSLELARATSPPFRADWDAATATAAVVRLSARATDARGRVAVFARDHRVDRPPSVAFTSPRPGPQGPGPLVLTATASDDGRVVSVRFSIDGQEQVRLAAAPWTWTWTAPTVGAHRLEAVAEDDGGARSSASLDLEVVDAPPSLAFLRPAEGDRIGGRAPIELDASDDLGLMAVELSVGGRRIGRLVAPPWRFDWDTCAEPDGPRTLLAVAIDSAGQRTEARRTILIDNAQRPPVPVAVGGPRRIQLAWTRCRPVLGYDLFHAERPGVTAADGLVPLADVGGYTHEGRSPGTTTWYRLAARTATGRGPLSAEVSARTLDEYGLLLVRTDALELRAVSVGSSRVDGTRSLVGATGRPRWSPDGSLVAVARRVAGVAEVVVFDWAGATERLSMPGSEPDLSGDGRLVAVDRVEGCLRLGRLSTGTSSCLLRSTGIRSPRWSGGASPLLVAIDDAAQGALRVFPPAGGGYLSGTGVRAVAWSPTGTRLARVVTATHACSLDTVEVGTSSAGPPVTRLRDLACDAPIAWRPDGGALYAVHDAGALRRVLELPLAPGPIPTAVTREARVELADAAPGLSMSPDGRALAVLTVSGAQGTTVVCDLAGASCFAGPLRAGASGLAFRP